MTIELIIQNFQNSFRFLWIIGLACSNCSRTCHCFHKRLLICTILSKNDLYLTAKHGKGISLGKLESERQSPYPVKYDLNKHHRQSIRLKGYDYNSAGTYFVTICSYQRECLFGEIVEGQMVLNRYGLLVQAHWQRLPNQFLNLELDRFVVMPNHIHGILVLTDSDCRGVALGQERSESCKLSRPNATPLPIYGPKPGSLGVLIRSFKSTTTRRINQMRQTLNAPVWQRNYYDHIIRNELSLQHIRQYIQNNPLSWQQDKLHPDNQATR